MKKIFYILFCTISLIFLNSCSTKPDEGPPGLKFDTGKPYTEVLHKLKKYSLSLEIVSKQRSFKAGENAAVTFKLTNTGKKPLVIYEWMMNEEDNIALYYIPFSPAVKNFDKGLWNGENPSLPEKPKRSVLSLNPRNSAYVDKKLKFLKNIEPGSLSGSGAQYLIAGELNLTTVSARSPLVMITVTR